jgi:hypothetical protein
VSQELLIIDLDTGNYKRIRVDLFLCYEKLFCFSRVVISATESEILIFDMDTGGLIERSFVRYVTDKFLKQMKLSPNKTTLAIPLMNGDVEFIRLSIAQNPLLPTLSRVKAAIRF